MSQNRYTYITAVVFTLSIIAVYIILNNNIQTNQETTNLQIQELTSKTQELTSQIQEQQELIQTQEETILNQNNTLTRYLNQLAELTARISYLEKIVYATEQEPQFQPLYFTSFNVNNPNNALQITSTKAEWNHSDRTVEFSLVYPAPTPITNFTHRFSFCLLEVEAGDNSQRGIGGIWHLTNEETPPTLNSLSVWGEQVGDQDGVYYLYFAQKSNDVIDFIRNMGVFDAGEEYYLEISRQGKDCCLKIYNDTSYSQVISETGYIEGLDTPYHYLGMATHHIRTDDIDDWTSGYVENLMIAEPPNP